MSGATWRSALTPKPEVVKRFAIHDIVTRVSRTFAYAGTFLLVLVFHVSATGQHGKAEPGFYNFDYHGDLWTGEITSFDPATRTLNLRYEHKGKVETFTGVLKPPVHFVDEQGNTLGPQVHVEAGDRITAYYIAKGLKYPVKEGDKKREEVANDNLIFRIKLLKR